MAQEVERLQGEAAPLDLSAMMPTPEDLAAIGLEGYAPRFSWTDVLDGEFTNVISGNGIDPQEAHEILQAPGLVRSRGISYGLPSEDTPEDAARQLTLWADEFQRASGLSDVLQLYINFADGEPLELSTEIGDESYAIRYEDQASDTDPAALNIAIVFRSGNLVGQVQISDFVTVLPDEEPTIEEVETLAQLLLDGMDVVRDQGGPGLDSKVLRLETDGESITFYQDQYEQIDGRTLPLYGEGVADTEQRQELSIERGINAVYALEQTIPDRSDYGLRWSSRIRQFESEDAAETMFERYPDLMLDSAGEETVTILEDEIDLCDGGFAVTTEYADDYELISVFVLVDDYILSAELGRYDELPPLEIVAELASIHAKCVQDNVCELEYPAPLSVIELADG